MKNFKGQLMAKNAKNYFLAGKATVTLKSQKTGTRFTYKITQCKNNESLYFVKLLQGPNNETDFGYMGCIFDSKTFKTTRASKISKDAKSYKAFNWVWQQLMNNKDASNLEIWHEGTCGCCGRKLTVPESIENGIGPVCAKKYN